ncbi:hypothetical protein Tc00.1047053509875.60 [Trypanosoma cruzi]|uniref:Uncharacterized protein n=1 Tax=Trypanosoma cruzi (strain CL Brener) TaxID=353153 RepID=Q4E0D1_TRYCC|nr:hypothetical protein Tc00.1047053509875.60 [Trypanosoma cruzi]EAN98220.1 hypothetical protein Tc00.1047053509875.60 [Trypanosoma cruzi]|eukprot:XP_820071.1 hypothetical protein [Trypanosoma cruzi strain CL Brener]
MSGDCAFFLGVYMRGVGIERCGICGGCRRLVGPRFGCPPKFITLWAPQRAILFFMESCAITNDTLDCCVPPSFFFFFYGMYESFACCGENCICYCAIGLFFPFVFIPSLFLLLLLILLLVMLRLLRAPCLHLTHQMEVHDHCLGRSLFFLFKFTQNHH